MMPTPMRYTTAWHRFYDLSISERTVSTTSEMLARWLRIFYPNPTT